MIFTDLYGIGKRILKADRIFYFIAFLFLLCALVLEALPASAVAVFTNMHGERELLYSSFFSASLVPYGNSFCLACGFMTVLVVIASALCLANGLRSAKPAYATLASSILAFLFALLPLFAFGKDGVTSLGAGVASCLLASVMLQAAVLAYEHYARRKK